MSRNCAVKTLWGLDLDARSRTTGGISLMASLSQSERRKMYLSNGIQDSKSCFIHDCCDYLASILPGDLLVKRYEKFIVRYNSCGGLHWYYGIAVI